jgi:hypothetical protein
MKSKQKPKPIAQRYLEDRVRSLEDNQKLVLEQVFKLSEVAEKLLASLDSLEDIKSVAEGLEKIKNELTGTGVLSENVKKRLYS